MKRIACITAALLVGAMALASGPSRPRTATQQLAERNDAEGPLAQSIWGFCAVNMKGDTLVWLNPGRRMVPASNMKLITTGTALLRLGGSYRYHTTLATDGFVQDSVLVGNLYITGGGDPLIGNLFSYLPKPEQTFGKWNKVLTDNGIREIQGDIAGDGSWFGGELTHTDWSTEDIRTRDGVVPSGLTWRGKMGDTIPDGPYPAALHYLEWLRADSTIFVSGSAVEGHADSLTVLGDILSLPLRDIAGIANRQSDNFIAETLLKTLGKSYYGDDSYGKSLDALHKALSPLGLMGASGQMRFADGSGLSRKNYISPSFMVSYLRAMARSKAWNDFLASLPFPGERRTTLEKRLPGRPYELRHRIRMKSGSMNGVRCFSGYILPGDGSASGIIAFSLLTNNAVASNAQVYPILDEMIESLAHENE